MSRWERKRVIREAYNANRKVSYNGERVYVNGLLAYDPDAQDPQQEVDEEATKLWMYETALKELASEDRRYGSNYNTWWKWNSDRRLWWIGVIEAQAEAGQNTIGAVVVARAVEIRLTRSRT